MVGEGLTYVVLPTRYVGSELCRDDLEASDGSEVPGVEFDLVHTVDEDGVELSAGDLISTSPLASIFCRPISPTPPSCPNASFADLFLIGWGASTKGIESPEPALVRLQLSTWVRKDSFNVGPESGRSTATSLRRAMSKTICPPTLCPCTPVPPALTLNWRSFFLQN